MPNSLDNSEKYFMPNTAKPRGWVLKSIAAQGYHYEECAGDDGLPVRIISCSCGETIRTEEKLIPLVDRVHPDDVNDYPQCKCGMLYTRLVCFPKRLLGL